MAKQITKVGVVGAVLGVEPGPQFRSCRIATWKRLCDEATSADTPWVALSGRGRSADYSHC